MGSPATQNPAQPPVGNAPGVGMPSAPQLNPQQQQQMMQMMQQRGNMAPRAGMPQGMAQGMAAGGMNRFQGMPQGMPAGMPQGMPQSQMGQGQMGQPNQQQMLNFASMMQQRFGGAGQNRPAPVATLK